MRHSLALQQISPNHPQREDAPRLCPWLEHLQQQLPRLTLSVDAPERPLVFGQKLQMHEEAPKTMAPRWEQEPQL